MHVSRNQNVLKEYRKMKIFHEISWKTKVQPVVRGRESLQSITSRTQELAKQFEQTT